MERGMSYCLVMIMVSKSCLREQTECENVYLYSIGALKLDKIYLTERLRPCLCICILH
jgi:hypothetical protein